MYLSLYNLIYNLLRVLLLVPVRAHIMEAELATLYSPDTAASLRSAQLDCEKCIAALGLNKLETA